MPIVTPDDVQVGAGRLLSETERAQVTQWIGDAELLIRTRLGDLFFLDQDVLAYVVRESVLNRLRNPEGLLTEAVDDYSYRFAAETRRITILDEWWNLLDPDAVLASSSIRPYFEPDTVRWPIGTPPADGVWDSIR